MSRCVFGWLTSPFAHRVCTDVAAYAKSRFKREWADYDDANDASVQITEVTHEWVVYKKEGGKGKKKK